MHEFRECAACAAKPGSPTLCDACLHNRGALSRLHSVVRHCLDELETAGYRATEGSLAAKVGVIARRDAESRGNQ